MQEFIDLRDHPNISSGHLRKLHIIRLIIFVILGCLTLTILFIISYWVNSVLDLIFTEPTDPKKTEYILFVYKNGDHKYVPVRRIKGKNNPFKNEKKHSLFELEGTLYGYSDKKLSYIPVKEKFKQYLKKHHKSMPFFYRGITTKTAQELRQYYGKNKIKIEKKFLLFVALEYFLLPVNFFQFSIGVGFFFLNRVAYSLMVLGYVSFIVVFKTYEYNVNINKMRDISKSNEQVLVKRRVGNEVSIKRIFSKNLVIGDVVIIEQQTKFTCDLLLIEGNCLVNEAMLTGESIPVSKSAFDVTKKEAIFDGKCMLSSGTFVIFLRSKRVVGLVIGTGWNTTKGNLLNPIVFTDKSRLNFENDFLIALFYLFILNISFLLIMMIYEIANGTFAIKKDIPKVLQFLKSAYPPSIYFISMASLQISSFKLKAKFVSVLRIEKIIEGGVVGTICYDKTGTITESSLKMFGFACVDEGNFLEYQTHIRNLLYYKHFRELVTIISCCHSLIKFDGKIFGDPLEEQMFFASGSFLHMDEIIGNRKGVFKVDYSREFKKLFHSNKDFPLRILKINEFNSERKLMSVVVQNDETNEIILLVKGAPESVKQICNPGSIPNNFDDTLRMYNEQGLRTIAVGYKVLKLGDVILESIKNINLGGSNKNVEVRQSFRSIESPSLAHQIFDETEIIIEKNIEMVGFLLFENPLKEGTIEAILELKNNGIKQLMITGDNIYTAVSVAYSCELIEKSQSMFLAVWNVKRNRIDFIDFNVQDRLESVKNPPTYEGEKDRSVDQMSLNRSSIRNIRTFNLLENAVETCRKENRKIAIEANSFVYLEKLLQNNEKLRDELLDLIVVYGRSSAAQKEKIVSIYKEISRKKEEYVAFVGDGSNDCRALKVADIGLSIGNDESSFAAAFISSKLTIAPIIEIIIEGKVCLANAFQNFKAIMLSTFVILFSIFLLNFLKLEFLRYDYIYLFMFNFPSSFLMSISPNREKLTIFRLNPTLRNFETLFPMGLEMLITFSLLLVQFFLLRHSTYHKSVENVIGLYDPKTFDVNQHFFVENKLFHFFATALMIVNCFNSYRGYPFKKGFFTNFFLVFYNVFLVCFILFNVFLESILPISTMKYYISYIRVPIYINEQLVQFFINFVLMLIAFLLFSHVFQNIVLYKDIKKMLKDKKKIRKSNNKENNSVIQIEKRAANKSRVEEENENDQ